MSVFHVAIVLFGCYTCVHTYVASVCPKYFIYFKCMLHSSVSCCKCRPSSLVSMRVGRAKPRPPTHRGGTGRRRRCGEEAQAARCNCGRGAGESSRRPIRDERHGGVEETGASHPNSMGSGFETDGSDVSAINRTGTSGTQIRADGAEQTRASGWTQALVLPLF